MIGYTVVNSMNRSFLILSWILSRSLILTQKVGGPKDTLAPHLKKWGGQWPRGPPASYATENYSYMELFVNKIKRLLLS